MTLVCLPKGKLSQSESQQISGELCSRTREALHWNSLAVILNSASGVVINPEKECVREIDWIFFLSKCLHQLFGEFAKARLGLFKLESDLTLGQDCSQLLWLRSLFFKEVSILAKDTFLVQTNQLNSHVDHWTGLLPPNIATPGVCAGPPDLQHECLYPFRVGWRPFLLHSPQVAWLLIKLLLIHMGSHLQEFDSCSKVYTSVPLLWAVLSLRRSGTLRVSRLIC